MNDDTRTGGPRGQGRPLACPRKVDRRGLIINANRAGRGRREGREDKQAVFMLREYRSRLPKQMRTDNRFFCCFGEGKCVNGFANLNLNRSEDILSPTQ